MNEYGLDADYFAQKLKRILQDVSRYTPAEMARELARMSVTADNSVLSEYEFLPKGLIVESKAVPDGWKLVPVSPTNKLLRTGYKSLQEHDSIERTYKDMLSAAPEAINDFKKHSTTC